MSKIPTRIVRESSNSELPITVRIGKSGVIDSVIDELIDQLSSRSLVKIKLNQGVASGSSERMEIFSTLATKTSSVVSFSRGNIVVLWSGK
ncbi:MAG TPA: YhbY family RNA-binding protein [Candidatus Poseidoniales archaeon]|nr:MAG TPA: YhbY family RNA-binding protein [Candidatus Poseidoniales archaeon]|tara:strand:- start:2763 stop:3035 length:273 start_codon:yes stop_codon:yes gene_type:complete